MTDTEMIRMSLRGIKVMPDYTRVSHRHGRHCSWAKLSAAARRSWSKNSAPHRR
ncbi:MAG: hypothetical protein ABR548_03915 [Actinomycetota bacterium]|nr:hypothetical protein [Actinomycetota bacterium]